MRIFLVLAVIMLALGGYILLHGLNYPSERSTLQFGDFHATVEQQRQVPTWIGVVLVAGGAFLLAWGAKSRGGTPR